MTPQSMRGYLIGSFSTLRCKLCADFGALELRGRCRIVKRSRGASPQSQSPLCDRHEKKCNLQNQHANHGPEGEFLLSRQHVSPMDFDHADARFLCKAIQISRSSAPLINPRLKSSLKFWCQIDMSMSGSRCFDGEMYS